MERLKSAVMSSCTLTVTFTHSRAADGNQEMQTEQNNDGRDQEAGNCVWEAFGW